MSFSSPLKLDRNNFLLWKSVIVLVVKGHDLGGYLFGTQPIPEKMIFIMEKYGETKFILNPTYVKWVRIYQRLLCWLLSSISESVLPKVVGFSKPHKTWKTLEMVYASQPRSRVLQLKTQLQTTRKGSLSMDEYLTKMKMFADNLKLAGYLITNDHAPCFSWPRVRI